MGQAGCKYISICCSLVTPGEYYCAFAPDMYEIMSLDPHWERERLKVCKCHIKVPYDAPHVLLVNVDEDTITEVHPLAKQKCSSALQPRRCIPCIILTIIFQNGGLI